LHLLHHGVEALALVSSALAENKIPLGRNSQEETYHSKKGDTVYAYQTNNHSLNDGEQDRAFKFIKVFIQPERFVSQITTTKPANIAPHTLPVNSQ